jgi:CRP-like cAMP-binding protein
MMPVLDGYGVLQAVQNNDLLKDVPFIFLTAKAERNDFRKGMDLGADDYIAKPFDDTELLNAVNSQMKKRELLKKQLDPVAEKESFLVTGHSVHDILGTLAEKWNVNTYKKNQTVYTEGNYPNRLFYILKGKIKTFKTNDNGKPLVTELLGSGEYFGYLALFQNMPYNDTAEAIEDSELAVISTEDFEKLVMNNKQAVGWIVKLLAKNIYSKEERLLGLAYNSLRKKVAVALLVLQQKYGSIGDEKFAIDMNRGMLAAIAGTAKESLIRTLAEFRKEKIIDIHNGTITILNKVKLEHLIN